MKKNLISNIWCVLTLCVCALTLSACGTPPAPVDSYQISVSQEPPALDSGGLGVAQATDGVYRVAGGAGSVPVNAIVGVNNSRTGENVTVIANSDGSFVALIHALVGDKLGISVSVNSIISRPTYIYIGALNIKNPYTRGGNWYVGQVHAHTNRSNDGISTPLEMEAAYFDAGYHFVVSTDHESENPQDHWMTQDPFNFNGKNLLWVPGAEISFPDVHMNAWGATVPLTYSTATIQQRIDYIRANGGLMAINHPNSDSPPMAWDWHREVLPNTGYSFVEAFNSVSTRTKDGLHDIHHTITAVDLADEFNQVWWLGVDDNHNIKDSETFDQYAIVVQTDSASINQKDIFSSTDGGNFYIRQSAAGPVISSVVVEGNTVTVTMADDASNYNIVWKMRKNEIVQQNLNVDTSASYTVVGDEGYVRAEIERISDGKRAYTQPLFVANNVDLSVAASASGGTGAGNLIDNKLTTYWDAQAGTASVVIDVGQVRLVNAVKIDWYNGDSRRFNYKVETSKTGAFAGEQREVVRETYDNRNANTLDFFDDVARYIKVTITSQSVGPSSTVRINEVQVFDSSPGRNEVYLDNVNGDDFNSGLVGSPWRTFAYAREMVRPRDTLNFVNTGVPYAGGMQLGTMESGKNEYARIIFQGDPVTLTEIDATGMTYGITFHSTKYIDWRYFDIHSASTANIMTYNDTPGKNADINIMYNRLHDSLGCGFQGGGDNITLEYNLFYRNANVGALVYPAGSDTGANVNFFNNVFFDNYLGLQFQNGPTITGKAMNNISSANAWAAFYRGPSGTITSGYNCVEGDYVGPWDESQDIQTQPLFVNSAAGDFRLQPGSPCIDAGIDLNIAHDFIGSAPFDVPFIPNRGNPGSYSKNYIDIGAFEYH